MFTQIVLALLIGYLIGSIPFPFILGKLVKGIDLREVGSHNVGGRNAFHSIGPAWGILGGLLDFGKGIFSLWVAQRVGINYPAYLLSGLATVAGHNWPVWLRFKGGKGLAVAMGMAAYLVLPLAAITILVAAAILGFTANVTLAAAVGYLLMLGLLLFTGQPAAYTWLLLGAAVLGAIGILPDIIRTVRTPGGVKEYLKNPAGVYKKDTEEED